MSGYRFQALALLISFLSVWAPASGYDFIFKKHQVNNGLSENTVQAIHQDRQGFMWFGTKDGLNRFDGDEYKVFRNNPSNPTTIGNNFIRAIYEDKEGKLWIGTDNKLYIYNPVTENFALFDVATTDGVTIHSSVAAICAEDENTIWIGCMFEGVFRYRINEKRLDHFSSDGSSGSLTSNMVWRIFRDYSGTIWVGTRDGLNRFNPETGGFQAYRPQTNSNMVGFNDILAISEDSDGDLWLGTWSGGLSKLDKVTNTFKNYFDKGKSTYITKIRSIFEYEKNTLLIGADDGLYLFNKQTLDYHRVDDPNDQNSLSDQNVYAIYRDRENGIWIGTYFGGVNYVSAKNHMIEHYYPGNSENSLSGKAVSQFCEDEKGNIWIATEDGGLNYFDTQSKKFRVYKPQEGKAGLSYHNLHSVVLDGDNLWIGTFSRGVDVLNTRTNSFRNYQFQMDNPNSIDDNCVFAIYRNKKGEIFVGTPFGLSKFNLATNDFSRIGQVRGFIYDMQEDHQGSFWVATYGSGVFRLDPGSDVWKNYHFSSGKKNSLPYDKVIDAFLDEKQRLWFTTEGGGICKYNYDTDDFTTINELSGLPNNVAYGLLDDKYGNIWVSTNQGITRINPETLEMKTYTKEDGLQSNQFNYRSSYKSRNGTFYFGGINGFNAFNPDNLQDNPYVPPVAITRFELLDEDNPLPVDSVWKSHLIKQKKIVLKHNQASFKLGFVSMSYQATEKNRYTCIMEGLEGKWRSVGNQNSLTYLNLSPGEYVFRVKGSNNDGVWNDTGDYLEIEILPPVWKSGVAYLVYSLLLLSGLFYGGRTVYRRQHAKQRQKLEDFRLEKEKEMFDSKISFFTNVAHEIRTPVSLIKAPLECIVNDGGYSPETRENLDVIARNSDRLLDLVNQLLDFRKMEEDRYRFQFVRTDVNQLLNDCYIRFKTTAGLQKIDLQLHLPDKAAIANVDREAVTKIVSNLLTNALKFTQHKVDIFLTEIPESKMLEFSVSDDGPGIGEEFRDKVFEPFYQVVNQDAAANNGGTGIGLALSRQLTERHNGKIFIDPDFSGGSRFVVQLPVNLEITQEKEPEEMAVSDISQAPFKNNSHHSADKMYLLVVEDNEELKTFLEKNLRQEYNVLVAGNGLEALRILKEFSVDLIISDIVMPGMDGLELAKTIKQDEQFSHIPVILLSARTNIQTKIEGLEFGADSYIEKPFSIGFLKAQVSSLIENRVRILEKFSKSPFVPYGSIASNKRDEEFLNRLNAEIEKNISDFDFSIEKLALLLSVSRSNLQRKIKGISGMAPNDYIRIYRLKKAAKLLLQGDYRINEICFLVGFNSPSYFSRCFQKQFGVLPKEFVRSNEQEAQHNDKQER